MDDPQWATHLLYSEALQIMPFVGEVILRNSEISDVSPPNTLFTKIAEFKLL